MTEMSSQGRSTWLVVGAVVFLLLLVMMFFAFAGSNFRHRWGLGHFSGSRTDAVSPFVLS